MSDSEDAIERDYVLGTNDDELARLGLQHRVWRDTVLATWSAAGISVGSRVLDVGAGPGYATLDLAQTVGPTGKVVALERSARYAAAARAALAARSFDQATVHELDLMRDPFPAAGFDAAWCRWVACFVDSPRLLVQKIAAALRPGGVAIFHEYADYATWRLLHQSDVLEQFVQHVMSSWRNNGGEPNVARALPELLHDAGFTVRTLTPRIHCVRPGEPLWEWPRSFIHANLDRLLELGRIDAHFARSAREALSAAEKQPATAMLTPLVLEIVATKA